MVDIIFYKWASTLNLRNTRLPNLLNFRSDSRLIFLPLSIHEHLHEFPIFLVLHLHHLLEILYLLVHLWTVILLGLSLGIRWNHYYLRLWRICRHLVIRAKWLAHVVWVRHVPCHKLTIWHRIGILILICILLLCSTIFHLLWLCLISR